jgi:hypothetical protein
VFFKENSYAFNSKILKIGLLHNMYIKVTFFLMKNTTFSLKEKHLFCPLKKRSALYFFVMFLKIMVVIS